MKRIIKKISMIVAMICSATVAQSAVQAGAPLIFNQVPKALYVPVGFDSNDNAQVVFEAQFENSCYRPGVTEYSVDYSTNSILIQNKAQKYDSDFCLMVILEYKKEVNLGVLNKGTYNVLFADSSGGFQSLGAINVNEASTTSADDFLYAPIKSAQYIKTDPKKNGYVELKGVFTNSCMVMDNVKVSRPSVGVVQVLPIAKMLNKSDCRVLKENPVPFTQKVNLADFGKGRVLIHVRSLNGQAINLIEYL